MRSCAENPEAHLARCVTAEHRTILNHSDLEAGSCRGDGAANPAESAAYDGEVGFDFDELEGAPIGWR